jgi:transcriptional regulator with XRE-family HTH domain
MGGAMDEISRWGERVRALRVKRNWNQTELAEQAGGMSALTVSAVERGGNTTTDTLQRIADALGVDIGEFFVCEVQISDCVRWLIENPEFQVALVQTASEFIKLRY